MIQKWLQKIGIVFTFSILICALVFISNTFADNQITLITCDEDGNTGLPDTSFAKASITISDLDSSGNFTYYGIDVGTFEVLVSNISNSINTKRVPTNNLSFQITDFGDLLKYEEGKIYVLGYRVLYQPIGDNGLNIVESNWKMVTDSYFKVVIRDPFITCDSTGRVGSDDESFVQANITVGDLDNLGNYAYYGADIGVFKAPSSGNVSDIVNTMRDITNNLSFHITDFGNLSDYQDDQVYVLGYRVLYQPIGDNGLNIIESSWRMVPNSYFRLLPKDLQHLQSINYYYQGQIKTVEVKSPNESGLQGDELNAFDSSNIFIDSDLLTYKVKFSLADLSKLQNINVNLLMNNFNDSDIELVLSSAQINGKSINLTNSKLSPDNYSLGLSISDLNQGDNYLIYKARLNVKNYSNNFVNITNNVTIFGTNNDGTSIQIGTPFSSNCDVTTKINKSKIIYF